MEIINTKRLKLRPYRIEDIDYVHLYASDIEIVKYMPFGPNTYEESQNFVSHVINDYYAKDPIEHLEYAIELEGQMIGGVSICIDFEHKTGEMGWVLNPKYHNKGIMTEAAESLINYAIKRYNLVKVIAKCDSRNIASQCVMLKIGMTLRGVEEGIKIEKKTGLYELDKLVFELDI